jgi:small neutral amino acid transporter SnatA (MarC family)
MAIPAPGDAMRTTAHIYPLAMSDPATRLRLRLDAARQRWQADDGGVAVREVIAFAAIAAVMLAAAVTVLEVAGIDITEWMRD